MLFRLNVNDIMIPLNNLFLFHFVSVCPTSGKEDKIRSRLAIYFIEKEKKKN